MTWENGRLFIVGQSWSISRRRATYECLIRASVELRHSQLSPHAGGAHAGPEVHEGVSAVDNRILDHAQPSAIAPLGNSIRRLDDSRSAHCAGLVPFARGMESVTEAVHQPSHGKPLHFPEQRGSSLDSTQKHEPQGPWQRGAEPLLALVTRTRRRVFDSVRRRLLNQRIEVG